MSDDGYYYDDYEYLEWEGDPYSAVVCYTHFAKPIRVPTLTHSLQDDLAEHTMHSPVWVSFDPDFETASYGSDWEYYSDEFFDEEGLGSGEKMKVEGDDSKAEAQPQDSKMRKKRRKLNTTENIPELSLNELARKRPTVIWTPRNQRLQSPELPLMKEGQAEKVALLKDWREKFKISTRSSATETQSAVDQRTETRLVEDDIAEDIEGSIPEDDDTSILPPLTLTEETPHHSHHPVHQAHTNGTDLVQQLSQFPPNPDQPITTRSRKRKFLHSPLASTEMAPQPEEAPEPEPPTPATPGPTSLSTEEPFTTSSLDSTEKVETQMDGKASQRASKRKAEDQVEKGEEPKKKRGGTKMEQQASIVSPRDSKGTRGRGKGRGRGRGRGKA